MIKLAWKTVDALSSGSCNKNTAQQNMYDSIWYALLWTIFFFLFFFLLPRRCWHKFKSKASEFDSAFQFTIHLIAFMQITVLGTTVAEPTKQKEHF